jgi:ferritin-like metal-binding protein YciE
MNTSQTSTQPGNAPTINTYLSDMLALERHIEQPLKAQNDDDDVRKSAVAARVINSALDTVDAHIRELEVRLETVGGHSGAGLKSGVASALGAAAGAIGSVRKTEVSKYLRDDYSALCLASAGYTMLHATALGLGDAATAELAKRHLTNLADTIMRISKALPVVVLSELTQEGVQVDRSVTATAQQNLEEAWREGGARSGNAQAANN